MAILGQDASRVALGGSIGPVPAQGGQSPALERPRVADLGQAALLWYNAGGCRAEGAGRHGHRLYQVGREAVHYQAEQGPVDLVVARRGRLGEEAVTLGDLGKELGISKERVRQLEQRAMSKLRVSIMSRVDDRSDILLEG